MMAYQLSGPQLQAVEQQGCNLLVAAGAGSGKTTVLVERILAKLLRPPGCDIDRLLVLTFTNAAAAEMRQRIEEGLLEKLREQPEDGNLSRQLALLQQAPITTIHSFCLDVVRRNFYRLGLDAGFRIPSETERAILQEETLAAFLEQAYEEDQGLLAQLADCYGGRHDDSALSKLIADLYRYSRSQPHPRAWLEQAGAAFMGQESLDGYRWSTFLTRELQQDLALARRALDGARALALAEDVPESWLLRVVEEISSINILLSRDLGLEAFLRGLSQLQFATLPSAAKQGDGESKKAYRQLRDQGKKAVKELQKRYTRRSVEALTADLAQVGPLMQHLCYLVDRYAMELSAEKRRRNLVDFDDMEHFCLELLEDESNGVAAELRQSFAELLIDEYQDINAVQERILQLLQQGDNCFAVGDVKQSIYRFRLADPGLFLRKYQDYGRQEGGLRIDLNQNYRSEPGVIAAVNFLFRQLMTEEAGELDYDEAAELKAGRESLGLVPEFWLIDASTVQEEAEGDDEAPAPAEDAADAAEDSGDSTSAQEEHALAAEARLIARRALELQAEGYRLGEMVILLRATKNREAVFVEELAKYGVTALAAGKPGYLDTPEISLMLSLLAVIDNPLQDLELAAVLRSPLFGFSLDELVQVRFAATAELYAGLQAQAAQEGALAEKCGSFLTCLEGWRKALRSRRISELIWQIYQDSGYYYLAGALPQGRQRQANLWRLYQKAREYEAGSFRGLFRFLLYLKDSRGKEAEQEGQPLEQGEAIRIMSIHRSKGLEFPVVFLANLGGSFSLMDERQDIVWHKELGLGPKIVERKLRLKFPSLAHEAVARRLHQETMAEELRVLYVALTRPRDRLIITAGVKDAAKTAAGWLEAVQGQGRTLDGRTLQRDKRPLDWLGKALLRHPDAAALRQLAGLEAGPGLPGLLLEDTGHWRVEVLRKETLPAPEAQAQQEWQGLFQAALLPASPAQAEVEAVLSYRYPQRELCDYPVKWTVSALNRLAQPPEQLSEEAVRLCPPQEAWEEASTVTPAQPARRGSVHHKLLQYLDFGYTTSREQIREQLARITEQGLLLPEEALQINLTRILRFCESGLGQRFAAAGRQLRETSFTYTIPVQELRPESDASARVVLQGMLDAAFWEGEGWVLLDYKTGGFGKSEAELKAFYATQLGYYRRALADLWQAPVKECWLCFLDLEQNIRLDEN